MTTCKGKCHDHVLHGLYTVTHTSQKVGAMEESKETVHKRQKVSKVWDQLFGFNRPAVSVTHAKVL